MSSGPGSSGALRLRRAGTAARPQPLRLLPYEARGQRLERAELGVPSIDGSGYKAMADGVEIYDLHATLLHQLGLNHKRLTYRFGGRDMRLTDVHGEVIRGILA